MTSPVLLVILDGWGVAPPGPGNAVAAANPECFNALWQNHPHTTIAACGEEVGLPAEQFGNSEVGHLNLGAGRIVWQDITRIDKDIREGKFAANPALKHALDAVGTTGAIHLIGLVSDGGVHSVDRHYFALLDWLKGADFDGDRVFFHAITDGRDTPPTSGLGHVERLEAKIAATGMGRIASVCGRYYAMDRDKRWERTQLAWDMYTLGEAETATDALQAVRDQYDAGVTDEFLKPRFIVSHGEPLGHMRDGDAVVFFNFRADRARQFCWALTKPDFDGFARRKQPQCTLVTLTSYASDIPAHVMYKPQSLKHTLGEWLAGKGNAQFRCAETEKYAHVTYFFNGGAEQPNPREDRALVPSPKVATYDLQPEMSAPEVSRNVCAALASGKYPFVLVNFANPDMIGHTGIFEAAVKGIRATDKALHEVVAAAKKAGYAVLVTADHGNAEEMLLSADAANDPRNQEKGTAYASPVAARADGMAASTQHSHNRVPLVLCGKHPARQLADGGRLSDVAPTVLELMGIKPPEEMTGRSLLR
ncbi:MAG: 2,3-bisphosphoglycerate-independent phosphoglycerate mutase [Planctomycetes bacterium]|nr:2,3-bisphosphoglycerate-independent phosphoglycerate mutase [Planctomycetota bacterium]